MKSRQLTLCEQLYDNRFASTDEEASLFLSALNGLDVPANRKDPEIMRAMLRSLNDKNESEEACQTLINVCCEFKAEILLNVVIDEIVHIKKHAPEYSEELMLMVFGTPRCLPLLKKRFSEEKEIQLIIDTLSYVPRVMRAPLEQSDLDYYKKMVNALIAFVPEKDRESILSQFNKKYEELKPTASNNKGSAAGALASLEIVPFKGVGPFLFGMKKVEVEAMIPKGKAMKNCYCYYEYVTKDKSFYSMMICYPANIPIIFNGIDMFNTEHAEVVQTLTKMTSHRVAKESTNVDGWDYLFDEYGIIICLSKEHAITSIMIHSADHYRQLLSYDKYKKE